MENKKKTEYIAGKIATQLTGREVIALFGELGSGKTTFVRYMAKYLGVNEEDVSSPTFALVNEYKGKFNIYHFDMYRVLTFEDLYSTGFFDYLNNGILIIEWSENIENALPDDAIRIAILKGSLETERFFHIEGLKTDDFSD